MPNNDGVGKAYENTKDVESKKRQERAEIPQRKGEKNHRFIYSPERLDKQRRQQQESEEHHEMVQILDETYRLAQKTKVSFEEGKIPSKMITDYNMIVRDFNACLAMTVTDVDQFNASLPEGDPNKVKSDKLRLLKDLQPIDTSTATVTDASGKEALDMSRQSNDKVSEHAWDTAFRVLKKWVRQLGGPALAGAALLSLAAYTDAAKIQGSDCSIDSALTINTHEFSPQWPTEKVNLDMCGWTFHNDHLRFSQSPASDLADNLYKQFEQVFPKLIERFAEEPCDKAYKNIGLTLDSSISTLARADHINMQMGFHPERYINASLSENKRYRGMDFSAKGVLTHELMHLAQRYPYSVLKKFLWLTEGIAEKVRTEYTSDRFRGLEPGEHYTDGYSITAGFLTWIEQHKNNHILDKLNRKLQEESFRMDTVLYLDGSVTLDTFSELIGEGVDDAWAEYSSSQLDEQQRKAQAKWYEPVIKPAIVSIVGGAFLGAVALVGLDRTLRHRDQREVPIPPLNNANAPGNNLNPPIINQNQEEQQVQHQEGQNLRRSKRKALKEARDRIQELYKKREV